MKAKTFALISTFRYQTVKQWFNVDRSVPACLNQFWTSHGSCKYSDNEKWPEALNTDYWGNIKLVDKFLYRLPCEQWFLQAGRYGRAASGLEKPLLAGYLETSNLDNPSTHKTPSQKAQIPAEYWINRGEFFNNQLSELFPL